MCNNNHTPVFISFLLNVIVFLLFFFFNLLPQENRGGVIRWAWQHMDLQKMLMLRFLILIFLPSLSFLFYHSSSSSFDCVRFPRRTRRNKNHDLPNSSQQTTVVPSSTYPPFFAWTYFSAHHHPPNPSLPFQRTSNPIQSFVLLFFFTVFCLGRYIHPSSFTNKNSSSTFKVTCVPSLGPLPLLSHYCRGQRLQKFQFLLLLLFGSAQRKITNRRERLERNEGEANRTTTTKDA